LGGFFLGGEFGGGGGGTGGSKVDSSVIWPQSLTQPRRATLSRGRECNFGGKGGGRGCWLQPLTRPRSGATLSRGRGMKKQPLARA
jgi:hypothetical protein